MDVGDIVVLRYEETFSVLKIIHIDPHPDGDTFHCLNYWSLRHEPTEDEIENLEVECYHSPINGESIRCAGRVLCNRPVSEEELSGFLEYLKQTDFARYAEETGQDVREIIERAKRHHERGNELSDSKRFKEAIDEYTLAFEEFPMFYEAVDSRGIAYMGIGDLRAAIWDFETSIDLNPRSHLAYLSKGQCYLELGELDEVETTLLEGARRCPDQQDAFSRLLELSRSKRDQANAAVGEGGMDHARQKGRAIKKPWWRFWRGESMGSFGIGGHAHTEAGFFAILLTLLTYGIKWLFGFSFSDVIFVVPTFIAVFIGFYVLLFLVFLIVWSRK